VSGSVLVPECRACGHRFWYPRPFCPRCGALDVGAVRHPGDGIVHSCTVVRKNPAPGAPAAPYVLAYVELRDGPRILAVVNAADVGSVRVGDRVRLHAGGGERAGPLEFAVVSLPVVVTDGKGLG
jgi:uncharacterized protein